MVKLYKLIVIYFYSFFYPVLTSFFLVFFIKYRPIKECFDLFNPHS